MTLVAVILNAIILRNIEWYYHIDAAFLAALFWLFHGLAVGLIGFLNKATNDIDRMVAAFVVATVIFVSGIAVYVNVSIGAAHAGA